MLRRRRRCGLKTAVKVQRTLGAAKQADASINRLTGHLALMERALAMLGPTMPPIADSCVGTLLIGGVAALSALNQTLAVTSVVSQKLAAEGGLMGAQAVPAQGIPAW